MGNAFSGSPYSVSAYPGTGFPGNAGGFPGNAGGYPGTGYTANGYNNPTGFSFPSMWQTEFKKLYPQHN